MLSLEFLEFDIRRLQHLREGIAEEIRILRVVESEASVNGSRESLLIARAMHRKLRAIYRLNRRRLRVLMADMGHWVRYFVHDKVLGLAERFWKWSGTWGWFNLIFGISGSVAAPMGEYAAAVLLLTLGTTSLCSSLLHSNRRISLKSLGAIAMLLGYAYVFFVIYDFKGNQEWSHLSPYLRGTVVYLRAPTPISVQVEPRPNPAFSAAERL